MIIGVDFDNTIVCYDGIFHRAARAQGLISAEFPAEKQQIRDHLRQRGEEDRWTALQGLVYGREIRHAAPFPGVREFFAACRRLGIELAIISHKTLQPVLGPEYDLHAAAREWLTAQGFFAEDDLGLPIEQAFFEVTKEQKLQRIATLGCTHFIDDLPEFLSESTFPENVRRILFDPLRATTDVPPGVERAASWSEISAMLLGERVVPEGGDLQRESRESLASSSPLAEVQTIRPHVLRMLIDARLVSAGDDDFRLTPIAGGANNRVYRLDLPDRKLLLKSYFRHPDDPRDRLGHEFAFLSFAWERGLRCIAQPLAADQANNLGLYSWIEGRRLRAEELEATHVRAAVEFVRALNREREHPSAAGLPIGSEACFSLRQHLDCVGRRVAALQTISPAGDVDREALQFVTRELEPLWKRLSARVLTDARAVGLPIDEAIAAADRVLSPSDFGFHNALQSASGEVRFLDFEYAGWDDPAKLLCDFFCQVQVPVDRTYFEGFVEVFSSILSRPDVLRDRVRALLPIYQVKWCCIVLNDFLPASGRRRRFSLSAEDVTQRKLQQLQVARTLLGRVN